LKAVVEYPDRRILPPGPTSKVELIGNDPEGSKAEKDRAIEALRFGFKVNG
jgi:hypothetical protein